MCDESDDVLHTTLAQNAGIVEGSFKRYKFQLTTKRRHVASYMADHSETHKFFFSTQEEPLFVEERQIFCWLKSKS